MAKYAELCERYKKKNTESLIDTIAAGFSNCDELIIDTGMLDPLSELAPVLDSVCMALPFVFIVATEGSKIILGKKSSGAGLKNAAFRAAKTTAAIAVGAGVASVAGSVAAIPAAMGVHFIFENFKSKRLLKSRLEKRVETMRFLRNKWSPADEPVVVNVQMLPEYAAVN